MQERPKSGYDLLKEIAETTGGTWAPSKGTIYPLLKQLEKEELIQGAATETRGKTLFTVTEKGLITLATIREMGRDHHRKMIQYKNLILAIMGGSVNILSKDSSLTYGQSLTRCPPVQRNR